ncbi:MULTISPECIES: hypothetical protein [unclassified Mesorhizobium]|uniref:hypothetical protein n=1 Tax=unclassified Mesorhizobium TaxID=325217 RepID=UPI00112D8592|nr:MULTISPECIES: hypothetical protein [unclassified Mesorhizobium]MBZ9894600.1 hypothetical protein [Mesorhizobium sp. BR1-1-6]TPM57475.1 hypothetical protein FJ959_11670 [Mesorhizobium sp. B2-2-4]TPM65722.1 hypothetical protein FJ965_16165 [Mesorhizobium sp. B2-2-1]TPN38369.1 hypothetical protein FJ979_13455 [Mesorhizobium sp. B1-1-6]TPN72047.1 hypothetical protein FJ984_04145 [Mesorhizobium sp. B1-1-3]
MARGEKEIARWTLDTEGDSCFSEEDYKRRAGACSAEFSFAGVLSADKSDGQHLPVLHFKLEASHFPRGISRFDDSTRLAPIHKGDLTWEEDPRCTFSRSFRYDLTREQYLPDATLA